MASNKLEHFTFLTTPVGMQRVGVCTAATMLELFWQNRLTLRAEEFDTLVALLIDLMDDARDEQWRLEVPGSED